MTVCFSRPLTVGFPLVAKPPVMKRAVICAAQAAAVPSLARAGTAPVLSTACLGKPAWIQQIGGSPG